MRGHIDPDKLAPSQPDNDQNVPCDAESFLTAARDVDGFELAALDTLQHSSLSGDPLGAGLPVILIGGAIYWIVRRRKRAHREDRSVIPWCCTHSA